MLLNNINIIGMAVDVYLDYNLTKSDRSYAYLRYCSSITKPNTDNGTFTNMLHNGSILGLGYNTTADANSGYRHYVSYNETMYGSSFLWGYSGHGGTEDGSILDKDSLQITIPSYTPVFGVYTSSPDSSKKLNGSFTHIVTYGIMYI